MKWFDYPDKGDEPILLSRFACQTVGLPADRVVPLHRESVEASDLKHLDGLGHEVVAQRLVLDQLGVLLAVRGIGPASEAQENLDLVVLGPGS